MENQQTFTDKPISEIADDALNRAPFVAAMLGEFQRWTGNSSLAVGLHGRWGDGKTSVVNLLVPDLQRAGFRVLRFNAWEWSSSRDLTDAFFDEIAGQLGQRSRRSNEELAKAMKRYAARLKGGVSSVTLAIPSIKLLIGICAAASLWTLFEPTKWLTAVAVVAAGLATAGMWLSKILPQLADVIFPAEKENLPSLEQLRANLIQLLNAASERVLVIIDDIDRLAPEQLGDITRLVKSNGDLPNVCYLLVGDRKVMADHLATTLHVDGAEYLEKIIQFGFDLPVIDRDKLNQIFWSGLNEILSDEVSGKDFEAARWGRVYWAGVAPSLNNLRNVKRLLASLRVTFALLMGERAVEGNQVDLIAMETIRLFEPTLYRAIWRSKALITDSAADWKDAEATAQATMSSLMESLNLEKQEQWRALLRVLFPRLDAIGRNVIYGQHDLRAWSAGQRVCASSYFDRYFRFGVGEEEVSTSDLQTLLEPGSSADYTKMLDTFSSRGKLATVMGKLRNRASGVPVVQIEPLVAAIFEVGDKLQTHAAQMFGVSESLQTEFLVQDLLVRLPKNEAAGVIDRLFRGANGLRLPIEIFRNFLGHQQENRLEEFLTDKDLEDWKKLFVDRFLIKSKLGNLLDGDGAGLFLHLWQLWGGDKDAKGYVAQLCETQEGAMKFLDAITQVAHSSNLNKSGGTARPYIRHTDIAQFIDPEVVNDAIGVRNEVDEELLRLKYPAFGYFEKALKRRRAGTSDDGFRIWHDDEES